MTVSIVVIMYIMSQGMVLVRQSAGLVDNEREPEYGLDFVLEYDVKKQQKKRSIKSTVVQSTRSLQSYGEQCQQPVELPSIDHISSIENGLFMMETSGRGTLSPRYACSVESAAMRSGLVVHLVMFSSQLDLRENTTCQLYMSNNNIKFYTINVENFAADSPLESFFSSSQLSKSSYSAVHTADALRLLLVYKFGGFYLDLDYVILNDLTHYKNMVLQSILKEYLEKGLIYVTNSAFAFSRHHHLLLMAMHLLQKSYNPSCWACIGPGLISECVHKIANTTVIKNIPESAQINFVKRSKLMPVNWNELFPEKPTTFHQWKQIFKDSSAVHFFSHANVNLVVDDDPQYSAYALLGPRYCPLAYFSDKNF